MIIKTVLLGLISAGAAGSVMYFGTLPSDGAEAGPTQQDGAVKRLPSLRETIKDMRTERGPAADADAPTVSKKTLKEAIRSDREALPVTPAAPKNGSDTPVQKKWLDQYTKSRTDDENAEPDAPTAALQDDDTYESTPVTIELFDTPIPPKPPRTDDGAEDDAMVDDAPSKGVENTAKTDEPIQYFKIENGVLVQVDGVVMTDTVEMLDQPLRVRKRTAPKVVPDLGEQRTPSSNPVIDTVMTQAASIAKPELRDQAYFEIVDFALAQDDFVAAEMALDNIVQDDINYTAKSRIAVAFAQRGMAGMAFATIDGVEDVELRDFMRLQVIQAMVAPQNLPPQWREGRADMPPANR